MKQTIILLALIFGCMHLAESATRTLPTYQASENYVHDLHYWMAGYYNVFHPPNLGITSCNQIATCFTREQSYYFLNYLQSMTLWVNCLATNNFTLAKCPDERDWMIKLVANIKKQGGCWTDDKLMKGIYPAPGIFFQGPTNLTLDKIAEYSSQSISNMDTGMSLALKSGSPQLANYQASGRYFGLIAQSYYGSIKV